MNLFGYLILSLAKIITLVTEIYTFIIAGAVIISWVGADPYNPIVRFLRGTTEPLLQPVRRFLPKLLYRGGIDLSPLIVIFLLILVQTVVGGVLTDLARSLLR